MIDFLKYRYACLMMSLVFMGVGLAIYGWRVSQGKTGFEYAIDFVGGTELTVAFAQAVSIDDMRSKSQASGWADLTIQSIGMQEQGGYREFVVRTTDTTEGIDQRFKKDITAAFPQNTVSILSIAQVGAEVGKDIQWNSIMAVILSMLIILLYVAIRSKYRFAVGAVVALAHDMLAVLVVFLLFGEPISVHVLAAILAILGYSLNDTIVIFSRIRENMKKIQGQSESYIVNLSINQTLRRTLLTSLSTLLTVLAIFFLGGEVLHGFSLAMLVGVVAGTYSSVYIASPVMLAIHGSEN